MRNFDRCQTIDHDGSKFALITFQKMHLYFLSRIAETFETFCYLLRKKDNQVGRIKKIYPDGTIQLKIYLGPDIGQLLISNYCRKLVYHWEKQVVYGKYFSSQIQYTTVV